MPFQRDIETFDNFGDNEFNYWKHIIKPECEHKKTQYYECNRTDGMLNIGPSNGPLYAITSWRSGFNFLKYDERAGRLTLNEFCDPPFEMPLLDETLEEDIDAFITEIPLFFREIVEPFRTGRALILRLIRLHSETTQLAKSNPALLFILCNKILTGKISLSGFSDLIYSRRRDIAKTCGCFPSKSVVRTLSRMRAASWKQNTLECLANIVNNKKVMQTISFLPDITQPLILLVHMWPEIIYCSFFRKDIMFHELIKEDNSWVDRLSDFLLLWDDIIRLGQSLFNEDIAARIRRLEAISSLEKLHDNLVKNVNLRFVEDYDDTLIFPPPLLNGNAYIIPIVTMRDLAEEGRVMKHCVALYSKMIMNNVWYIYRVLHPERATLSIRMTNQGPEISELKGIGNQDVSTNTIDYVKRWICEELVNDN